MKINSIFDITPIDKSNNLQVPTSCKRVELLPWRLPEVAKSLMEVLLGRQFLISYKTECFEEPLDP